MSVDLSLLEGAYLRDLLAQPQAVADTVAGLRTLPALPARALTRRRIVLTGLGSSFHGLYPLLLRLVRTGHSAFLVETAELIHTQSALLDKHTLVIVVSQSGRSAETVQLLELLGARSSRPFVIGITNTSDSPLALQADAVVPLRAGAESSVSCKTYLATLVALEWLGGALGADDRTELLREVEQAAPVVRDYLSNWRTHVAQLAADFTQLRHLFLLGRALLRSEKLDAGQGLDQLGVDRNRRAGDRKILDRADGVDPVVRLSWYSAIAQQIVLVTQRGINHA